MEFYVFPDFFDLPLRIDEDGCAQDTHKLLAVVFSLAPTAQRVDQFPIRVGQEWEVEFELVGKTLVRFDIVWAKAIDFDAKCLVLRNSITEFRCFYRSSIGVIFGVDVEDVTFPTQALRRNLAHFVGHECKVRN